MNYSPDDRPFVANLMLLMLDWANFALSVGFVMARIIKLLLVAFLFVGKIDTPLLVPGVSFLDKIPEIFLRDVLLLAMIRLRHSAAVASFHHHHYHSLHYIFAYEPALRTYDLDQKISDADVVINPYEHEKQHCSR